MSDLTTWKYLVAPASSPTSLWATWHLHTEAGWPGNPDTHIVSPHSFSWVTFLHSPQQCSPLPRRGYISWGFCSLVGPVWQPLHPGSYLRLWGILLYLVPKQAGPAATLAGIRRHQQRWVTCSSASSTPCASPGCLGTSIGPKIGSL